ncbi:MAG: phosphoribosylaminoimidazole synthetase [Sulfurospirillaceae bacterium]|nr:phosphoribosylaminoimidazole synthetase [Sulfurospirillaceae bacterium]MDD2825749.1 phosphoribosylaminoimidazole synthetase [Sulfurospirillaceae bacterium]
MLCAEKLQRLMMAGVLIIAYFLMSIGSIYGNILLFFVIAMIVLWAITDFCPSIWTFSKLFGHCKNYR